MTTPVLIYHGQCHDGFCCAWLFHRAFGGEIELIPATHGQPPPEHLDDREVYIADFSYPRGQLEAIHASAANLLVLDHHVSAAKDLEGLDYCRFDMQKSGGRMSWEYLCDERGLAQKFDVSWTTQGFMQPSRDNPHWIVSYTEDRDLWLKELPHTDEVNAALRSFAFDIGEWDAIAKWSIERMVDDGAPILRDQQQQIDLHVDKAAYTEIAGYEVLCVNATLYFSEIAGRLAEGHPFGAAYFDTPENRTFSLRSTEDGIDVSEIAKQFGGGGHEHAAGFRIPLNGEPVEDRIKSPLGMSTGVGADGGFAVSEANDPADVYGRCPKCGGKTVMTERRPDGNNTCENGHVYPRRDAVPSHQGDEPPKPDQCPKCGGGIVFIANTPAPLVPFAVCENKHQVRLTDEMKASGCGANAPGGGGFQSGNTCGGEGGGVSESQARGLYDRIVKDGGFTYQPIQDKSPASGYALSIFPDDEQIVEFDNLNEMVLWEYMDNRLEKFSDPRVHFGAWHNNQPPKGDNKVYLDLSIVIDDQSEATELAKEHGQLAMFNLSTFETVEVMTQQERDNMSKADQKQKPNATIVAVPQDAEGRVEIAIRMYERITGKKSTPEAIARLRERAGLE